MSNAATITINGPVDSRNVTTSKGLPKTIYSQKCTLETKNMRIMHDLEVDGPHAGYPVGSKYVWDIEADVIPGRYGPELARRQTLVPVGVGGPGPGPAKS